MNSNRWRILCIAILGALLLAGCNSDDDDDVTAASGVMVPVEMILTQEGTSSRAVINPEFFADHMDLSLQYFNGDAADAAAATQLSMLYTGQVSRHIKPSSDMADDWFSNLIWNITGDITTMHCRLPWDDDQFAYTQTTDSEGCLTLTETITPAAASKSITPELKRPYSIKNVYSCDTHGDLVHLLRYKKDAEEGPWTWKSYEDTSEYHAYTRDGEGRITGEIIHRLSTSKGVDEPLTAEDWTASKKYEFTHSTDGTTRSVLRKKFYWDYNTSQWNTTPELTEKFTTDARGRLVEHLESDISQPLNQDDPSSYARYTYNDDGCLIGADTMTPWDGCISIATAFSETGCLTTIIISEGDTTDALEETARIEVSWEKRQGIPAAAVPFITQDNLGEGLLLIAFNQHMVADDK